MAKYTEEKIKTLTAIEAIRLRPGMYLGRMNLQGFSKVIQEFIPYIFDHLECEQFHFQWNDDLGGKFIFTQIKKTIPYRIDEGIWVPGLPGMDTALTLNATCAEYTSKMYLDDKLVSSKYFEKGKRIEGEENANHRVVTNHWEINFKLDNSIWSEISRWNPDFIAEEMKEMAFLNKGRKFLLEYEVEGEACRVLYCFKNGLKDKLDIELLKLNTIFILNHYLEKEFKGFSIEVAFAFKNYGMGKSLIHSFANQEETMDESNQVIGFLNGILSALNVYSSKYRSSENFNFSVHEIKKYLTLIINIKIKHPQYTYSRKEILSNPEVIKPIEEWISNILSKSMESNEKEAFSLLQNFLIRD